MVVTEKSENRIVICKAGWEMEYAGYIINFFVTFGLVAGKKVKPTTC
jgi:hypothetical protein